MPFIPEFTWISLSQLTCSKLRVVLALHTLHYTPCPSLQYPNSSHRLALTVFCEVSLPMQQEGMVDTYRSTNVMHSTESRLISFFSVLSSLDSSIYCTFSNSEHVRQNTTRNTSHHHSEEEKKEDWTKSFSGPGILTTQKNCFDQHRNSH